MQKTPITSTLQEARTVKISIAVIIGLSFLIQRGQAQTGGPGQPEFIQFQQAGTANLVNPSSGTFSYQIPLFSIGGYPINLTYQSGIQMEDVASMAGLGWNLNAGSIVRTLRGLPDDFDGDIMIREFSVKDNITYGGKTGIDLEVAGLGAMGVSVGGDVGLFYNTYKGWGLEYALKGSLSASYQACDAVGGSASLGMGTAVNSQNGVDKYIAPSVGLKLSSGKNALNMSLGKTWSVNSNEGLKTSLNTGLNFSRHTGGLSKTVLNETKSTIPDAMSIASLGFSRRSYLNNMFQPDIDYPFENISGTFSGTVGFDAYYVDPTFRVSGYFSKQTLTTKTRNFPAVGLMYDREGMAENTLMDFNREKKLPYFIGQSQILPIPFRTPDVFNLNAQGISMTFSVNKNDIGVVGDARASVSSSGIQGGLELGFGNLFKAGANLGTTTSFQQSRRWNPTQLRFKNAQALENNALYQQIYFKNDSENNLFTHSQFVTLGKSEPVRFDVANETALSQTLNTGVAINTNLFNNVQPVRQSAINYMSALEASTMGFDKNLKYFTFANQFVETPRTDAIRKDHHLSEVTVTQADGMKYVFGLPLYNKLQKEVTFNVGNVSMSQDDLKKNLVSYSPGSDNSLSNSKGNDYFYECNTTPAYVTQFLITAVLSPDYRDLTNNGISDDDLGNYVKFTYFKETFDYKWRTPVAENKATFNRGLRSDLNDDKGTYVYGEKELCYVRSIESRTEIAEFFYSKRDDAFGVKGENGGKEPALFLRKLDSIKVFSLADRQISGNNAVPSKTIYFNQDYSLCPGTDNGNQPNTGKLTLAKVSFAYEKSKKGKLTPYSFQYGQSPTGTINPPYAPRDVNRWGYFQKNVNSAYSDIDDSQLSNIDYPYALQDKAVMDENAYAWNLTGISIPGGGKMKVDYEAHDYAYLQDKKPGQMFKVTGLESVGANSLYGEPLKIFFNLTENINTSNPMKAKAELEEKYIRDLKGKFLYFRFLVKLMPGSNAHEYISGYAEILDYNVTSGGNSAWITLKNVEQDDERPLNGVCNPILKSALQYMRINRNRMVYGTQPNAPTDFASFINQVPGAVQQLTAQKNAFNMGVNTYCITQNYCKEIVLDKSSIRLYNPTGNKIAGGSRAREVSINDNWNAISGNTYPDKAYTTTYQYTRKETNPLDTGSNIISSGVADYEPLIGGDEISLKQPLFYKDAKKKAPDTEYYVEEPVNESLFPSPQIVYSRVTQISNKTNLDVSKTGKIVNEYYTSRDAPVKVHRTTVDERRDKTQYNAFQFPFFAVDQQHDIATVSQGYSIELNGMSGLPKATWVYNENGDRISGEETFYADNEKLTVVDKAGAIQHNTSLGMSVDYTVDGRYSNDRSTTTINQVNLNMSIIGVATIPIIMPLYSSMTEEKQFQSIVINKIIHRNAIPLRKVVYDQSASIATENLAYEATTGEVLLTKTTNEFNDTLYSFKYPAYWMYSGMGPAYANLKMKLNSATLTSYSQFLKPGDELRAANGMRLWVGNNASQFLNESNLLQSLSTDFQIYNSGAKNLVTESAGQVVTWNFNPLSVNSKISFNPQFVLNSSALQYNDVSSMYCESCPVLLSRRGKNDFLSGRRGNWKPKQEWFFLTDRSSSLIATTSTNIRMQGLFNNYNSFWNLPQNSNSGWTINNNNWEWKEKANLVNTNGLTIETEDRIGRKVASLVGYRDNLVTAQAFNSGYGEALFEGFEDFNLSYCTRNGNNYILKRTTTLSGSFNLASNEAHTGKYSAEIPKPFVFTTMRPIECKSEGRTKPDANCNSCVGGLYPLANKSYIFSCWVKVNKEQPVLSCDDASVVINGSVVGPVTLRSEGPVIEGWQRIMGTFKTATGGVGVKFTLNPGGAATFYDDLRIFPADGSMVSYVYDDVNLRLTYSLDDNNYFTKNEYNNQGELIRVKKETERGIITVKEGHQALNKQP